ncbi:MAG: hypothetical protein RL680_1006 [Actinomycetota bacterium]|jgi:hypothetical protein
MAYSQIEERYLNGLAEIHFPTMPPQDIATDQQSMDGMQLAAGPNNSGTTTDTEPRFGRGGVSKAQSQAAGGLEKPLTALADTGAGFVREGSIAAGGIFGDLESIKNAAMAVFNGPKDKGLLDRFLLGLEQKTNMATSEQISKEGFRIPFTDKQVTIPPAIPPGVSDQKDREHNADVGGSFGKIAPLPTILDGAITSGKALAKTLAPTAGNIAKDYLRKSDLKRLPENQRDTLIGLYDKALETKPEFDSIGQEIASQINGEYMAVSIKKSGRLVDKALGDYNGDVTKTKDLVRSTIIVDTPEQAAQVLNLIRQRFSVRSEGFRNLLDESVDAPLGYRDAKMNVEINGTVAEIQVNFREMLKAKKELHPLYEELSKIERAIMSRPDKVATSKELARIETLEAKQKAGYDAAFSEAIKRSKISPETGAPLRRAESGSNGLGGETSQAAQYGTESPAPIETGMPSTSKNLVPFENFISKTSNKSLSDLATDVKGAK